MDSAKNEFLAVGEVEKSLVVTDLLVPHIPKQDKEPLYDGYVCIYKNRNHSNENMIGRVSVQVKGTFARKAKKEIVFPVKKVALEKYLTEGVFYFVGIVDHFNNVTLYYLCMTPVLVKDILTKMGDQKSKSLRFGKFPNDRNSKLNLFFNFHDDVKKQVSFVKEKLLTMEDLQKSDLIAGITFSFTAFGNKETDHFNEILKSPVYLYAKMKGLDIHFPVSGGPVNIQTRETISASIRIRDRVFYNTYTKYMSADKIECQFGHSMSLIIEEQKEVDDTGEEYITRNCRVTIQFSKMLRECVVDLDFVITLLKTGTLCINDNELTVPFPANELEKFNVKEEEQRLKKYQEVCMLLNTLHVEKDINVEELTVNDKNGLDALINCVLYNGVASGLQDDLNRVQTVDIAGLKLLLAFEKTKDIPFKYKIHDYFHADLVVYYKDKDKTLISSIYTYLQKDGYLYIDNIDYSKILPSYKEIEAENPEIFNRANNDMLMMLLAYDEGKSKNNKLLCVAEEIATWLMESAETIPLPVKTINLLQIIRRKKEFSEEEKEKLYLIAEDSNIDEGCRTAAYLLLGLQIPAKRHFEKLSKQEQMLFIQYPVYKFWDKDKPVQQAIASKKEGAVK
ncbi:hypothetical protein LJC38_01875 [Parabacteroides sp. OttesenSCG-928-K15]|nr:hypothetical protein [Parabacteroides sp. OttesenSCG-928-K15]